MDYKIAGVNIEKANILTGLIKNALNQNTNKFAGLINHPFIKDYTFAACTDGIGSKIIPLIERNKYDVIAKDLVAANLNDLVCSGAFPLFFIDILQQISSMKTLYLPLLKSFNLV
ncbi:MAG: AIR synthase related protein [Candidatus Gastranaerophilales bacterium]|nr:AIR synthase related protein [Candidatus Gastranaerophilales bacterium]